MDDFVYIIESKEDCLCFPYVFPVQISSSTQTVLNGFAEWQDEIFSETKLKKIYQNSCL
jgi:hypothetical protein